MESSLMPYLLLAMRDISHPTVIRIVFSYKVPIY
nr:MAG TPA: hypothetical protein [Caudoviricetes sp.]